MRTLITVADVKEAVANKNKIINATSKTIITPAARDVANENGIQIIINDETKAVVGSKNEQATNFNSELIMQIVQEVIAGMDLSKLSAITGKIADHSGLRIVRGDGLSMEEFPTGHPQDKIKIKELFTVKESPHISAGIMTLEDTSFYTERRYEEIVHVLEGMVECIVGNNKYTAKVGDSIYLPANVKITLMTPGKTKLFYTTHPAKSFL